jgi:hypothetical protein
VDVRVIGGASRSTPAPLRRLQVPAPSGWIDSKGELNKAGAFEKAGGDTLCNGKIKATWEDYTNPNNDYTVIRQVTLTGVEAAISNLP